MAERAIRIFGDPVLKSECRYIDVRDAGITGLVTDLIDTVKLPGRAGVAANQIGVDLRAFSYNVEGEVGYILNPVVTELSGEPAKIGEGCLSVPELWFPVERYPFARVEGVNLAGERVVLEGEGLLAQALQHECDHLEGMLYLDRLDRENRGMAYRRIRESEWF
ncbi:peptide deformylase [Klugiella xanthotipulae]|uniref:Peptide deformylase n=1 Tax=Klugiella xanthotipulae TaxID=244735 RepID=A0A543HT11_9MICO|nr:peptide deformylase [Klugiella xanthotipulae]TQM61491.1 peptide deformylase [Klugiella xanthotipulae]